MRLLVLILLTCVLRAEAQNVQHLPSLKTRNTTDPVVMQSLFSDSTVTSTFLWIRDEVRPHYHATHSEHIYVVEGTAQMLLGHQTLFLRPGDLVFIPAGTIHAVRVTSKEPLKVLSIHTPAHDGSDRVWVEKTGW
ncbi:MAG: cupin domain-containing protein [Chitinophagales bacterium]|nr:cupin domain-containing protein [Chitinophagales bacterium]MDW8428498.1 cupin domain-containing protein [Chitinophagales bacterium]